MMSSSKKSDAVSIRFKYENLKQEIELVGVDEGQLKRLQIANNDRSNLRNSDVISNDSSPISVVSDGDGVSRPPPQQSTTMLKLILSCTVAAGVQFGWALQLSLLTPYIQTLGIQHAFSSFIWLCGPITGLMVQPCVGEWSDNCTSKYGRRRPFILVGSLMISVAVVLIGFSADIGYLLGDSKEHCSTFKGTRTRAAIIFILGFWMLDLANNTVQGPARALLADLAGPDQRNSANAIFCSWMAIGNILGFSAGASGNWNRWFPFLLSRACCEPCGNLKAAFLVAVVFLSLCTSVTLYFAKEVPLAVKQPRGSSDSSPLLNHRHENSFDLSKSTGEFINKTSEDKSSPNVLVVDNNSPVANPKVEKDSTESFFDSPGSVLVKLLTSLRHLPPAMHPVLIVMALTWLSWFPFFLFDTDWMGREVYHGDPKGTIPEVKAYDQGVREGAFGLLLNSVVLGISSLLIEPICRLIGSRIVWATSNYIVFGCMAITAVISLVADRGYSEGSHDVGANRGTKIASLIVFAILGVPLAVTYSVPFSVTAEITADSGGGQGLAIGVLNLAIVIPQMIVSLGAGPWDALFGGGNIPAFVLASFCALASGMIGIYKLPDLSNSFRSTGMHFG